MANQFQLNGAKFKNCRHQLDIQRMKLPKIAGKRITHGKGVACIHKFPVGKWQNGGNATQLTTN